MMVQHIKIDKTIKIINLNNFKQKKEEKERQIKIKMHSLMMIISQREDKLFKGKEKINLREKIKQKLIKINRLIMLTWLMFKRKRNKRINLRKNLMTLLMKEK